jgi:hypothetical protein
MKTAWFHDAETGEIIGKYVLPRTQSQYENCTIHNYNLVPHPRRNLLVHGSSSPARRSSTSPTRRTRTRLPGWIPIRSTRRRRRVQAAARTSAAASGRPTGYGGDIFESDTRRGLHIWGVRAWETKGPMAKMDYLNPQTSHFSIDDRGRVQN